jgi:hypothetical protein
VGAVGRPKVHNLRAVFSGDMKRTTKANWMEIRSQQYDFFDDPARFFFINSRLFGIPFDGLHIYSGNGATMQIRVASLFQVVDAKGEKMNRSETVTFFNDMCLLAPSTLIDKNIRWETVDSVSVKATFTNRENTVSATLHFNDLGELTNFISDDRFQSGDGKTYVPHRWSTPIEDYREFDGRRVGAYGEAVWHMPEGDFTYARFRLKEIDYNSDDFR